MTFTPLPWRDPLDVARAHAGARGLAVLCSDGGEHGRWSYVARDPDRAVSGGGLEQLTGMLGARRPAEGPPFAGGVLGLLTYDFAARLEPVAPEADPDWPALRLFRYPDLLAFDHRERRVLATPGAAAWLDAPAAGAATGQLSDGLTPERPPEAYEAAVAEVTGRIAEGEIFQANIARSWRGRLVEGATPFDAFERLMRTSPAPFAAYLDLGDRALVSHSPERFLKVEADGVTVETRPIKGTRPRGRDAAEDGRLADELLASAKDRAENLMIVDLMRNDLARVCEAGSVEVPDLFRVETYPSVHHLVSTVRGRLKPGAGVAELLAAAFPPGSITGAPKVQAMKVIAECEQAPRGPWCGSLFWAGFDGAFDSSVLIRTAAFVKDGEGWRFRTLAGAGIVADSEPAAELAETEAKIAGLRRALTEAT